MRNLPLLAACLSSSFSLSAADVASRIVGYNVVDCPAGSDTVVSVPFHQAPSFSGAVSGTPSILGDTATITPAANPVFGAGAFTGEPHYLRFLGGTRAGWAYEVSGNGTNSIEIALSGDDLDGIAADDRFEVIPHWTLDRLFPQSTQTALHESSGKLPSQRGSSLLFFDATTEGIGLAPDRVFFLTPEGWFRSAAGFPAAGDMVIPPGTPFVIRHHSSATATKFIPHQMVSESESMLPLRTSESGPQDTAIATVRPVPVKLSDLDLPAVFVESASNEEADRADELLVYDNASAALNKTPGKTYFRAAGEWRLDDGNAFPSADDDLILPSTGVVVRKASGTGASLQWVNAPRY